jgi:hypothetical protein
LFFCTDEAKLRHYRPAYEITWEWRRLHNEELYDLYSSPTFIRVIKSRKARWAGHVVLTGERRGAYMILVRIREARRPLGRSMRRWKNNIKNRSSEKGMLGLD